MPLSIPGLRWIPSDLIFEDVALCFDQATENVKKIDIMLAQLERAGVLADLYEILVVGGGSASPYLRESLR